MMATRASKVPEFDDYVFQVRVEEDGEFFLSIPRLPGCVAAGETLEEARENLEAAFQDWTECMSESGRDVPAPIDEAEYSGKVVLRMPKWLHAAAVEKAEEAGTSLNTLLVSFVSKGVGMGQVMPEVAEGALEGLQRQVAALQTGMSDLRSGLATIVGTVQAASGVSAPFASRAYEATFNYLRASHHGLRMRVEQSYPLQELCRLEESESLPPGYHPTTCIEQ